MDTWRVRCFPESSLERRNATGTVKNTKSQHEVKSQQPESEENHRYVGEQSEKKNPTADALDV